MMPLFPESEKVLAHHLIAARATLDNFGIADPAAFVAELQKTGKADLQEGRSAELARVGKHMPEGLRALANLLSMLVKAAEDCEVSLRRHSEWENIGLYLEGRKYWVGVNYSEPEYLYFFAYSRIDPKAAAQLGVGKVREQSGLTGQLEWLTWAELDSEEIHFYARSKVGQLEWLAKFLQDCLAKARSIETPDQPPIPDEPEGS
jgi:hypothetical protein